MLTSVLTLALLAASSQELPLLARCDGDCATIRRAIEAAGAELAREARVERQAPEKPDWWMRGGYAAFAVCSLMDLETTGRARERGLREANPLLAPFQRVDGGIAVVNGLMRAGVGLAAYELHKRGARGVARAIVWGSAGIGCAAAANNVRVLREDRRRH